MKTSHKATAGASGSGKALTLGDLIVSTYDNCGDRASRLLQLALAAQMIRLTHGFSR